VEFRKQNSSNGGEESESEHTERRTNNLKLTEGLRMTETGTMLSAESECKEQRTAAASGCLQTVTVTNSEQ